MALRKGGIERQVTGRRGTLVRALAVMVLVSGCGQRAEEQSLSATRQAAKATRPGTSRAVKKAALKQAADAVLQAWAAPNLAAAATDPKDPTKIPHYFGPFPNWANSPLALPDATVIITGTGTGATATATVGAGGAITAITVTDPGNGYTNASVQITGSGTGATAKANLVRKGFVSAITVATAGTGYTAPTVTITGGGAGSGATATAYGSVERRHLVDGGSGYTFPIGGLRPARRAGRRGRPRATR